MIVSERIPPSGEEILRLTLAASSVGGGIHAAVVAVVR
jgi:hypothetical protein